MSNVNNTVSQHYISQAEQRLNAVNPGAKPRNQRIVRFEVLDRDGDIRLTNPEEKSIKRTLHHPDLFTIDRIDARARRNLEDDFNEYERGMAIQARSLAEKLRQKNPDIGREIAELFC